IVTPTLIIINILLYIYNYASNKQDAINGLSVKQANELGGMHYQSGFLSYVTSLFIHGSLSHIMMNMLALYATGWVIAQFYGAWLHVIGYFVSGTVGNMLVAIIEPTNRSVGASTAIFGLLGLMLVASFMPEKYKNGLRLQPLYTLMIVIIAIVMPMILGLTNVNILAHVTGLISGMVYGLITMAWIIYSHRKNPE